MGGLILMRTITFPSVLPHEQFTSIDTRTLCKNIITQAVATLKPSSTSMRTTLCTAMALYLGAAARPQGVYNNGTEIAHGDDGGANKHCAPYTSPRCGVSIELCLCGHDKFYQQQNLSYPLASHPCDPPGEYLGTDVGADAVWGCPPPNA
ncbi:hypothetical protein ED733_000504 [Metarhizium rileyi]|uniref:Uncharacterized protein n=1 Tax=Metarhizium rileyi (strain RCEF 4871) TaxID=1649241 RepID=A0A5C6G0U0_METRR|nr:hypothetical protein ED733_000504 [Metarhizium rileyi]